MQASFNALKSTTLRRADDVRIPRALPPYALVRSHPSSAHSRRRNSAVSRARADASDLHAVRRSRGADRGQARARVGNDDGGDGGGSGIELGRLVPLAPALLFGILVRVLYVSVGGRNPHTDNYNTG